MCFPGGCSRLKNAIIRRRGTQRDPQIVNPMVEGQISNLVLMHFPAGACSSCSRAANRLLHGCSGFSTIRDPEKPQGGRLGMLQWILKIIHDPEYLTHWELWYYGILRSCRIFVSTNSSASPNPYPAAVAVPSYSRTRTRSQRAQAAKASMAAVTASICGLRFRPFGA